MAGDARLHLARRTVTDSYDVIVVGGGGAGLATTWWLARTGFRVLTLDRFEAHHTRGSSHGRERIVRLAYADPVYVRLACEALEMWHDLDASVAETLIRTVGGVDTGLTAELEQIARGCDAVGVAYEWLDPVAAGQAFPGLHFDGRALVQPDAGCVDAHAALDAFERSAVGNGAVIRRSEAVTGIDETSAGVEVTSDRGTYRADSLVFTTGAWAAPTLAGLAPLPPITVTREQVGFFRPRPEFTSVFPTFIDRRETSYYGLPTPSGLVKIAEHYTGPVVDPDTRAGELEPRTWHRLLDWVRHNVPGVDAEPVEHDTCLYASAPDEDFIVDRRGPITVGVGLGGHGFKFLPALGRRIAEIATGTPWPDNPFGFSRSPRRSGRSLHK